jgi:predicted RNA binding protein YcfA (HicA-like mRNA interferase family)
LPDKARWRASKARRVFAALLRIGWDRKRTAKKKGGSHRVLERRGWSDYVFAFHDKDELHPPMLARIGKATGLKPEDL